MLTLRVKSTWVCGRSRLVPCCALFLLCSFVTARPGMGQVANSASLAESESKATSFYKQGMAALQKGDLESARVAFEKVAQLAPQSPEAHNSLGWVLLAQNEVDSAIKQFQSGIHFVLREQATAK